MNIIIISLSAIVFFLIIRKLGQIKTKANPNYFSYVIGFWGISLLSIIIGLIAWSAALTGLKLSGDNTKNVFDISLTVAELFIVGSGALASIIIVFMRKTGFRVATTSAIGIGFLIEFVSSLNDISNAPTNGLCAMFIILFLTVISFFIRITVISLFKKNKKPKN